MKRIDLLKCLFLIALIFNSCQTNEVKKEDLTIAEAQLWFESYLLSTADNGVISSARKELNVTIKKEVKWNGGKSFKTKTSNSVILPVWFENNYRFGKKANRQLKISKDSKGNFQQELIEFMATEEHIIKHGKINYTDFSGTLSFHDWKTGFKKGYQLDGGKVIGYVVSYTNSAKGSNGNNTNGRTEGNCGYYQTTYVSVPSLGLYFAPRSEWVSTACPGYSLSEPYDYYGWFASQYGCEVTNTCIDYQYQYQEPEPQPPVPTITNNVTDPCIYQQVNNAIAMNIKSEINDLPNKFFGVNQDVNLEFNQVGNLENSVDAITETVRYDNNPEWLDVTISFNENTLPTASQEYILATTYHELLHAILHHNNIYGPMQHDSMADFYIKTMKTAFKMTFNNLPETDAELLAWGGLQETEAWEKLSSTYKAKVLAANADYKSGQKGTKC